MQLPGNYLCFLFLQVKEIQKAKAKSQEIRVSPSRREHQALPANAVLRTLPSVQKLGCDYFPISGDDESLQNQHDAATSGDECLQNHS
jgi:hypothetical protein